MTMLVNSSSVAINRKFVTDSITERKLEQSQQMNMLYMIGLTIMWISIGFDFKSRGYIEDPLIIQFTIISLYMLGFLIAFFTVSPVKVIEHKIPLTRLFCAAWVYFTIYLAFITYVREGDVYAILKNLAPYAVICLGLITFIRHVQAGHSLEFFMRLVVIASLIATIWAFINGKSSTFTFDEDEFAFIEEVRFQIISYALLPLFGWSIYHLSKDRNIAINSVIILFVTFVVLIAKTRGLLLGIGTVLLFVILVSDRPIQSLIQTLAIAALTIFAVVVFTKSVRDIDILDVWKIRIFGTEFQSLDITSYMRLAEYKGQMDRLFESVPSAILGRGLLEEIAWDPYISYLIDGGGTAQTYNGNRFIHGVHSTWINSFFHGGFLAGWIPAVAFGSGGLVGIFLLIQRGKNKIEMSDMGNTATAMILTSLLPMSSQSVFIERIAPLAISISAICSIFEWERARTRAVEKKAEGVSSKQISGAR